MELIDNVAIEVKDLSILYSIRTKGLSNRGKVIHVKAIDNVSISINSGEVVALLGKNGSGKTTLLRTISGVLKPERGTIETKGRVFTLRGANPGLIPHLTSRENVKMLAGIYGIEKIDLPEFEKEVEDFCELGDAYDREYSSLSSGMAGRVGFGFTTSLNPQILLMDETLGVGDVEFRKKAEEKAKIFMEKGETIVLSTHSLNLAKTMCNRGLVLDEGKLVFDGTATEAVEYYLNEVIDNN
jgi:ABC-type polysaccharide/polyol phosphate transport system ATPase subunit